jgi:hypothetical protein
MKICKFSTSIFAVFCSKFDQIFHEIREIFKKLSGLVNKLLNSSSETTCESGLHLRPCFAPESCQILPFKRKILDDRESLFQKFLDGEYLDRWITL